MTVERVLRMTRQRRVILDELRQLSTHPTADQVYQIVRRHAPRISLATVYRNLDTLSRRGMITKLETAGLQRRFDGNTEPHWHVRCVQCGRVDDVEDSPRPIDLEGIGPACGYEITGVRVELVGQCPECHKGRPKGRRPAGNS